MASPCAACIYNGWKSIHGLKHQTVDIAHGLTIDLHGPMSLRRNDLTLLRESDIVNRLREQIAKARTSVCYVW